MLNKFLSGSSFALLFAFCSPTLANEVELPLEFESTSKCITAYDSMFNLQDRLVERDLKVASSYSHFRIAQENYTKAFERKSEIELILQSTDPSTEKHAVQVALWNSAEELVHKWDNSRNDKLAVMQDIMYGRQLKTNRLKDIRRNVLRCKDHLYDKVEVARICQTKVDSRWCEGRF